MTTTPLYCPECEAAAVTPCALAFVDHDGRAGEIAGFVCALCGNLWEAPDAVPTIIGAVDLSGRPALDIILERLRALGCDPRPRSEP